MTGSARVVTWQRQAAVELIRGETTVRVVPELGMLVGSLEVGGVEHVARPGGVGVVRGGHTTAVPLLHPWANRLSRRSYTAAGRRVSLTGLVLHTDSNGLPMHGTMIGRPEWEIVRMGSARVTARYAFGAHPELLASFPFPHAVEVTVRALARGLRVETAIEADGGLAVPVGFGWHPYWQVPGSRDEWTVTLPAVAHARLDRRGIPTGRARPEPEGQRRLRGADLDDLFAFVGGAREVTLAGPGGRLLLELDAGYPYLQVYAPAGHDFCCLEPMSAPTNALVTGDHATVRPGDRYEAAFSVRVRSGLGR